MKNKALSRIMFARRIDEDSEFDYDNIDKMHHSSD